MTESTKPIRIPGGHFLQNPITVKELRSRMRGGRAFLVLSLHVTFLSIFIVLVYAIFAANSGNPFGPDTRAAGKTVFGIVVLLQAFIVIFVAPSFSAGAIAGEKERQTFDILRTTLLTARKMVGGKLFSALSYVLLLLVTAIPLMSVGFFLGGVSLVELVVSQVLLLAAALAYASIGLYYSSRMKSTLSATVSTFGTGLFFTAGLPLIAVIALSFVGPFLFAFSSPPWYLQAALIYAGVILGGLSLPATLIASEVILLQEGAVFAFTTLIDGRTIWVFSPWLSFLAWHGLMALLFIWLTVRRVRKVSDG